MELDDFKKLYKKEEITETPEISLEKQKEIHLPLEKIRKNMRLEFWMNFISMVILIPLFKIFSDNEFIRWSLYGILLFVVIYYYIKFYWFYRKISNNDLSTFQQLIELKYELRNNIELYKSYYIASIPFFYSILLLYIEKKYDVFFKTDDLIIHYAPFIIFFAFIATFLGFGKWWWDNYYNKYIKEVEKLLNDLK